MPQTSLFVGRNFENYQNEPAGQVAPQSQLEESANEPCAGVGEGSEISSLRRCDCS